LEFFPDATMSTADPVLDTLFRPFSEQALILPTEEILFLRARDGAALRGLPLQGLTCEQTYKPDADALQRAGFRIDNSEKSRRYSLTLVLPPRQRDEARALLARAISATKAGGRVIACGANDEGAKSHESDLEKLAGPLTTLSKSKCRVFWTGPLGGELNRTLLNEWQALDAPRPICEGRFVSRPGVFAWDRIDVASGLLAKHLPPALAGQAADLGAGFGYLAHELLTRCPGVTSLDLYEAEKRALDLAQTNLTAFAGRVKVGFNWLDVSNGLPHSYDVIVSNPPFHAQRGTDRPDIGRRFITVAAQSLNPGGRLWLVANRHLPYESVLDNNFGTVRIVTQAHGFKIIEAIKSSRKKR
jgi:16S rRNA (guanine1207-N2)-methyltransferase